MSKAKPKIATKKRVAKAPTFYSGPVNRKWGAAAIDVARPAQLPNPWAITNDEQERQAILALREFNNAKQDAAEMRERPSPSRLGECKTIAPQLLPPSISTVVGQLESILETVETLGNRLGNIRERMTGPRPEETQRDKAPQTGASGQVGQLLHLSERLIATIGICHAQATEIECSQG